MLIKRKIHIYAFNQGLNSILEEKYNCRQNLFLFKLIRIIYRNFIFTTLYRGNAYIKLKGVPWLQENNKRKFLCNSENNKGFHSHKIVVPSYKNYISKRQANVSQKYISQR